MAHLHCEFFSNSLGLSTSMQVILPQATGSGQIGMRGGSRKEAYPVLYLLHGWSDDDTIWMRRTSVERYVAGLDLAVVMPRVGLSYYQNMASGMRYWDFISEELPELCRQWFPLTSKREQTFAAGLSMGGYGAFRLGLARPENFGAVASLSGALDVRGLLSEAPVDGRKDKLEAIWGAGLTGFSGDSDLFGLCGPECQAAHLKTRFYQWCGTEDFLYGGNLRFRDHARKAGLDLHYSEGPGDHSWEHWDREIQKVLAWLMC